MQKFGLCLLIALLPVAFAQTEPTVEGTIELFDEGILEAPPEAALANITGWEAVLRETGDAALVAIADNLAALAAALGAETVDGAAAAELLGTLGEQTTAAGDAADAEGVRQIGSLLTQVSQQLMMDITPSESATESDMSGDTDEMAEPTLEDTIAALEGDVAAIPAEGAVALVNAWEATLRASEDETLLLIADDLAVLAETLQAEEMDLYNLRDALAALGEQTRLVSTNAEGMTAEQLDTLGSLLIALGDSVDVE